MSVKRRLVMNQPQMGKLISELRLETGATTDLPKLAHPSNQLLVTPTDDLTHGWASLGKVFAGLTQEQFAAELGVTYSTINRWENGRSQPSPLAMRKIEELLKQMGDRGKEMLVRYQG